MYTVGLGDSPMLIARALTGRAGRYRDLLAANPHKPVVLVAGRPTFATLGVGERLNTPPCWLGAAPAPPPAQVSDTLRPGQQLAAGQSIAAMARGGGTVSVTMQPDGNFVLYDNRSVPSKPLWASSTPGRGKYAIMQADGNLVVYDGSNKPVWASATQNNPGAYAVIQSDGNFVVYNTSKKPIWASATQDFQKHEGGGGFDLGSALGQAWNGVQQGVKSLGDVANALHMPGANLYTAILTGGNLGDALKADINGFAASAQIATAVSTGNPSAIAGSLAPGLTNAAAKVGIHLNPSDVSAAVSAAQAIGDPSKIDPNKIAATALGSNYADAWNVATNFGAIASSLPPPPGLSYKPGATSAAAANHPLTVVAKKVNLRGLVAPVTPAAPAAAKLTAATQAAYGPYPKSAGIVSDPGPHGDGHGGGGHHGEHGFRPRGFRGGGPWGGWWGPWYDGTVYRTDTVCSAWGSPSPMNPDLHSAGTRALNASMGQPASAYVNGVLYLFSFADGVIRAQPCAAMSTT